MNESFLPLIRANKGRIVNLSSVGSLLKPYSPAIQSRFRGVESLEQVEDLAQEYVVRGCLSLNIRYSNGRTLY
jgi:carbonyl reductase 1